MMKYLDDPWRAVIESEVDGPNSVPLRMDQENPALARYSASRRVARTVLMGSAPKLDTAGRGLEDIHIKLGCVRSLARRCLLSGDALRRPAPSRPLYLYNTDRRYWYSTQQNVTRLARDRAAQESDDAVLEEIRKTASRRGKRKPWRFLAKVLACVEPAAVGEDRETRLVILDPAHPHSAKTAESPARVAAARILEKARGPDHASPRIPSCFLLRTASGSTI